MIKQLYYLTGLISVMVMMHTAWSSFLLQRKTVKCVRSSFFIKIEMLFVMVSVLLIHCMEASIFAIFYYVNDALPNMETSMYFSLASYATVGYGDVLLPEGFRLTGAAEGLVGTLMVSWTVATLISYFGDKK